MAAELEERFFETNRAQLLRWLPWLHLFRAFRIALDPRKLVLGALAAFVLVQGDRLIDALPFAPAPGARSESSPVHLHDTYVQGFGVELKADSIPFTDRGDRWPRVLSPLQTIIEPGRSLFEPGNTWAEAAYHWTRLLFHLALWSLLGAAIARMAAVQLAHRESQTARSALRFAVVRFNSTMGAPLLPLLFVGAFWLICVVLGLVGRVPGIGPILAGALWFLPLLIGVALAVMLLVIGLSWPLMVATISTEGTDAFDSLSRGYDYALNRTWYALWLLLLMVVYGTIVLTFATHIANTGAKLASWAVASGMGADHVRQELMTRPPVLLSDPASFAESTPNTIAGSALSFWLQVFAWLLQGFAISFFWTAATIIYFLLRLSLDAKPLDHVFMPAAQPNGQTLPLVGIPAAEHREAGRQASEGDAGTEPTSAS